MKILSAEQIRGAERQTMQRQGISSWQLMERAASAFADAFLSHVPVFTPVTVICGRGNNGGDGLAIARILTRIGFPTQIFLLEGEKPLSPDAGANARSLDEMGVNINILSNPQMLSGIPDQRIIIDALFGTGLNRPLDGLAASVVEAINRLPAKVFSVDLPSGLLTDGPNSQNDKVIEADYTFTFQAPKLSFFLCENESRVGKWAVLPIGLDEAVIEAESALYETIDKDFVASKIKARAKCSHKGTYGHALIIVGSEGKMGAAVLATRACLRTGAGLVTARISSCGIYIMQTAIPEAMALPDESKSVISSLPDLSAYKAIGVGPGIGTQDETAKALKALLQEVKSPIVLDADALNILSQGPDGLAQVPKYSILTPHPKEFDRLTRDHSSQWERMQAAANLARKHEVIIVLKGAYTSIHLPSGRAYLNTTGNPGMATGGSGDVLTGIITGLLAQGYAPEDAAIIGVNLHGLAGDYAARAKSEEAMIAGDIIEHIGEAYKEYHRLRND